MKLRAFLVCALSLVIIMIAGCAGADAGDRGTSGTTAASDNITEIGGSMTSAGGGSDMGTSGMPPENDNDMNDNGEYEAGEDGVVTDARPDDGNVGDDDIEPGDVTNDGVVTSTGNGMTEITDEAAFAPSYIDAMASGDKVGWGLGKERDNENRPLDAVNAEKKYEKLGGKFLASDGRICLTFDEGYENGYTEDILDTLSEKNVKAVFFVTLDYCKSSPELVKRMIDEGHIIGNHTCTHPSMPGCSEAKMASEVMGLHEYVKENFGYDMKYFRFPKGEFSEKALSVLNGLGYKCLFWSFAYNDWNTDSQPDKAEALAKIKDSTHSGIYLLHAVSKTNTEILGTLLDYWKESGYSVGCEL